MCKKGVFQEKICIMYISLDLAHMGLPKTDNCPPSIHSILLPSRKRSPYILDGHIATLVETTCLWC